MSLLNIVLIVVGVYAIARALQIIQEEEYYAAPQATLQAALAATASPNKPIVVPAPSVALNSPAATVAVIPRGAGDLVSASVSASKIATGGAVTKAVPVIAPAAVVAAAAPPPQLAPQYCGAAGGLPEFVSPEFVKGCTNMCLANQTLMPQMCECACARSQPFIMGIGL